MTQLTILFLRHGQTNWNKAGRWQGRADIPINETGQQQAEALCQRLKSWPIDTIYTSDLQRCVQTAVPLANELGLELIKTQLWRERDVGFFRQDGQPFATPAQDRGRECQTRNATRARTG